MATTSRPALRKPRALRHTAASIRVPVLLFGLLVLGALLNATAQSRPPDEADLHFEVATIKAVDPGPPRGTYFTTKGRHVIASNVDLEELVKLAYSVHVRQIVNGPAWFTSDRFDIDGISSTDAKPNLAQMRMLFRRLLQDRFNLTWHREEKESAVYALTVEKTGPKLTKTDRKPTDPTGFSYLGSVTLTVRNSSMPDFANGLGETFLDRPVVDQTGLQDRYDFVLRWTQSETASANDPNAPPDLYTAIREQLGLRLGPAKAPMKVLVIDRVEHPSPN